MKSWFQWFDSYLFQGDVCADSEAIPASLTFSQTANDILDHILSLVEEPTIKQPSAEETMQFSNDINGQKYELTLGFQNGILYGWPYRASASSCYFFKQDVKKVGLSGTIYFSGMFAEYSAFVTGTPSDPDIKKQAYAKVNLSEAHLSGITFSFKALCTSSTDCNSELEMINSVEDIDMDIFIYYKQFDFEDGTKGLEYNDESQEGRNIRQMLRSMIRHNMKNFLENNVALFQKEIEKALDKNEQDFFELK